MKPLKRIRTLEVPCHYGGKAGQVQLHVGEGARGLGAVHFQRQWLRETRAGEIGEDVLAALEALAGRTGGTPQDQ